jgi:hypothetical protein
MLSALGHLLPIAVGAALSTVPITATIFILLSPKRNSSAVPFLLGWVLGMLGVLLAGAFGASFLPLAPTRAPQVAIGAAEVVVGTGVVVVAIVAWRRALGSATGQGHRWMQRVSSLAPLPAFGTGFALNLRPKGLLLGAAAGIAVAAESLPVGNGVLLVVVYLAIATSTVVTPIVATLANPVGMEPRLEAARTWFSRNARSITAVVMILIGVVIIGSGLTRL